MGFSLKKKGITLTHKDLPQLSEGEWIEMHLLTQKDINYISSQTEREVAELHQPPPINGVAQPVQRIASMVWLGDTPEERLNSKNLADDLRICRSILNWNLFDSDTGKKIPHNDTNKKALAESPEFVALFVEAVNLVTERTLAYRKGKEKN